MGHFTDKTAVITGGASGIGRAVGEELARQGAIVVLADVDAQGAADVAAGIEGRGGRAQAVSLDVTKRDDVRALLEETRTTHGHLDLVFNNAGINVLGELRDTSDDDWDRLIAVNLKGVVHGVSVAYDLRALARRSAVAMDPRARYCCVESRRIARNRFSMGWASTGSAAGHRR